MGDIISKIMEFFSNLLQSITGGTPSEPAPAPATTPTPAPTPTPDDPTSTPNQPTLTEAHETMAPVRHAFRNSSFMFNAHPLDTGAPTVRAPSTDEKLQSVVSAVINSTLANVGATPDQIQQAAAMVMPIAINVVKNNPNSNADQLAQQITDGLMSDQAAHNFITATAKEKAGSMAGFVNDDTIKNGVHNMFADVDGLTSNIKKALTPNVMAQVQAAMTPAPTERYASADASASTPLGRPHSHILPPTIVTTR